MDRFSIPQEEIVETYNKLSYLKDKNPDLIEDIKYSDIEDIAKYLSEPDNEEIEVWRRLKKGNIYSFSIFLHEKHQLTILNSLIEKKLISNYEDARRYDRKKGYWRLAHGKALFEQYKLLQKYIYQKTGEQYALTQICLCDSWEEGKYDKSNARILKNYLRRNEKLWYNKHSEFYWNYDDNLKGYIYNIRNED